MQDKGDTAGRGPERASGIVVAESDDLLRSAMVEQLAAEGFKPVHDASNGSGLVDIVKRHTPDLVVLDRGLGDNGGIDVCRRLRGQGFTEPVIMLTDGSDEGDVVASLEAGANDYAIKPLRIRMLVDQIRRQIRQHETSGSARTEIGNAVFISAAKLVQSRDETRRVILTEKETMMLKYLCGKHPTRVPREELLSEVWGLQAGISTYTVETHIYRLRQKLLRVTPAQIIMKTSEGYALADGT